MVVAANGNGNSLVVEQVSSMLVEPLRAASVVLSAGPTIFNSSEPIRIPTITGDSNPVWTGENEKIDDSDSFDFGEMELMPTSRKSIKTIVRVSNELVRMAKMGVSAVLQRKIVEDVRAMLDDALLAGNGADDTVTGILNQASVPRVAADPADPDSVLTGLATLAAAESTPNRIIMSGSDFFEIRGLKDADGRYLLQPDITRAGAYQLQGVPVTVTNKLAAGTAIMGDMGAVAVVRDEDARVNILNEKYADYDQTGIRVVTRYDLGIIRPESLLILDTAAA